ncbi:hypothetical protein [Pedobacter nototheniae]|uniref:hypothetical protein n=1 Tax=Pedobacter nototheniae TaxID=2488994 RepID=UPI00103A74D3|nr:hypothetical protein [Pedobacter nototheniae]
MLRNNILIPLIALCFFITQCKNGSLMKEKKIKDFEKKDILLNNARENLKPLSLNINFKRFGEISIPYDSLDWDKINLDSPILLNLSFEKVFKQKYNLKTRLIASRMPLSFILRDKINGDVNLRIIRQSNTIWEDSIVFQKNKQSTYQLKRAFSIAYYHYGIHEICQLKILKKKDTIDITNMYENSCSEKKYK